jgi:A/G-specific adenine glycosylase
MELGARVCTARAPRCGACPAAGWCPSRGRPAFPARSKPSSARRASRPRFEDTDRWARGRVIAALAAGEELPAQIAADRLARVLTALERDGLVERGPFGVGLPGRTQ